MSPKRASLAGMLTAPPAAPPLPVRPAAPLPETRTPAQQTPEVRSPEVPRPAARPAHSPSPSPGVRNFDSPELPKYKRLERKEVLAWPDDLTRLSVLARTLNRSHGGTGERITPNTLIRVAMALLLDRADELTGATEDELRQSLGLD
jgi:hypothetical protein